MKQEIIPGCTGWVKKCIPLWRLWTVRPTHYLIKKIVIRKIPISQGLFKWDTTWLMLIWFFLFSVVCLFTLPSNYDVIFLFLSSVTLDDIFAILSTPSLQHSQFVIRKRKEPGRERILPVPINTAWCYAGRGGGGGSDLQDWLWFLSTQNIPRVM